MNKKVAIFPGSFDPFHKGHKYVVDTALNMFDEVYVCIGCNPSKKTLFPVENRQIFIEKAFENNPRVKVIHTSGLIVDKAKEIGATCIVKGARNANDFNDEVMQSDANLKIGNIPTVIIPTPNTLSYISSTLIRTLINANGDKTVVQDMLC